MRRWTTKIAVALFSIALVCTSIYAGGKIKISDAKVDLDAKTIEIFGKKFPSNPQVMLDDKLLEVLESSDTYVKAGLGENIGTGSCKLILGTEEQLSDDKKDPYFEVFVGTPDVKKPSDTQAGDNTEPCGDQKDKKDKKDKPE